MSNMSEDALTIKLADRLHNVKYLTIDCTSIEHLEFIKYYIEQTKEILLVLCGKEVNDVQKVLWNGIVNYIRYAEIK